MHIRTMATMGSATVLVVASVVTATPAMASTTPSPRATAAQANSVAALINEVAPDQGAIATVSTMPTDPATPISVPGAADLTVRLPTDLGLRSGVTASDGTVVYPSADTATSAAVQQLADGAVRAQTIIGDATAPTRSVYRFGNGFQPVEAADGTFWVVGFDDQGTVEIYSVAAAWARDASGADVPTHYEIDGDTLVQVVEPGADSAYPIVADPTWQWYNFGYGAGFSKAETKNLAGYTVASGFCGALYKYSPLGAACAVVAADWFLQAKMAANAKGCVFIATVPAPLALRWNSPECR